MDNELNKETAMPEEETENTACEAPAEEADRVKALLETEMRAAADMKVSLDVDAHIGETWYEAKG